MHSKLWQNESDCAWFNNECWYNVFMILGKSYCRLNPISFSHLTSSWTWVKSDQLELWEVEPTLLRDCYELSRLFNFSIYYLCVLPHTVKLGWDYFWCISQFLVILIWAFHALTRYFYVGFYNGKTKQINKNCLQKKLILKLSFEDISNPYHGVFLNTFIHH